MSKLLACSFQLVDARCVMSRTGQHVKDRVCSPSTSYKLHANSCSRGFTLIELLAVTAILVVITSVILANYSQYGGVVTLRNLAYDVALSVREAQTYGISVRRFGADTFSAGYGIHVRMTSPNQYILYADSISNNYYDSGETVEAFTLRQGFQINDLCVVSAGATDETCGLSSLDIVFKRPEPDAHIYDGTSSNNQRARIEMRSGKGDRASVTVEATGQISVTNVTPAP